MTGTAAHSSDVVRTWAEAETLDREPLLILAPLEAFLAAAGLADGQVTAVPIGDGHSNVTYVVASASRQVVLRRPPRGPLPPSTHDVLREARLLQALRPAGVRVPEVLAVCDDPAVVGAPFYVMELIEGHVLSSDLPLPFDPPEHRERVSFELVDGLAELHAVDVDRPELEGFGSRRGGYLERQVRRFTDLLDRNATRRLPLLERVASWLAASRPTSPSTTVVHGDYRLGNAMFATGPPPRLAAVLDWELATVGDPLADLGYLTAMWAAPDDPPNPMLDLSAVTRLPGFPTRDQLVDRYAERTGLEIADLGWYQVLALWKAAIFLEGSYKRYLAGSTDDPYFERLGEGVPTIAEAAWRLTGAG